MIVNRIEGVDMGWMKYTAWDLRPWSNFADGCAARSYKTWADVLF